jgi:hypothetical protein
MALPKINHPIFELTLPSTKDKLKFRPFLVKEEKVLLIAQSSEDSNQVLNAVKQVLNNCIISDTVSVDDFTTFDLEYIFLKIRSKSVNNIIELAYRDTEDNKRYEFEINLDEIEVKEDPEHTKTIKADDNLTLIMRYPRSDLAKLLLEVEEEYDVFFKILTYCLDKVILDGQEFSAADSTEQELEEFIQSLDVNTFKKIQEFFNTMPRLYHELKYVNSLGNERTIKLTSLSDFFTLG